MTPNVGEKPGHSFIGAMAYFMHDKRPEQAAAHPTSAQRVAWTETRNLGGVGPHTATRTMIDHAQQADDLKRAHGVKMTGRKSKAHVYAFSLSWHPDEVNGLDRAGMLKAADEALKFLKADHLQAVIIAHQDTAHPHVHIVLNRVQANGTMWNPSFDKEKFSQWANRYEHDNGKIVSPKRAEKWDQIEQGQKAHPDADERRQYTAARKAEQSAQAKTRTPTPGQILKDLADAQKARHAREWRDFSEQARRGFAAIRIDHGAAKRAAELAFKGATKGDWAQHFRDERTRAAKFQKRERSLSGIFRNAFDAARAQAARKPGDTSIFTLAMGNLFSSTARQQAFSMVAEGRAVRMREDMRARKAQALAALETTRKAVIEAQSAKVAADRAALMERQKAERSKMSEAWRQHYAQKAQQQPGNTYRRRKPEPLRKPDPRPAPRPVIVQSPPQITPKPITPAFTARAAGWLQGRAAEAFAAVQHVAADMEQRQQEKRRERFVRDTLKDADAKIAQARAGLQPPPEAPKPIATPTPPQPAPVQAVKVAPANHPRAGTERRQTPPASSPASIEEKPVRKDWKHLVEDRAIMSGAEPTNTENMRRRDADAGRSYEIPDTPAKPMTALERRLAIIAAKQRANPDPTPTPPKPTQRRRMKM